LDKDIKEELNQTKTKTLVITRETKVFVRITTNLKVLEDVETKPRQIKVDAEAFMKNLED